jgi:hypothetical protein
MIRAFDSYNPLYSVFREHGVYDEWVRCMETYNASIHEALPVLIIRRLVRSPHWREV